MKVFVPIMPRPAPASSAGAIGWMRAHLFSSPIDTLLTLGCIWILWQVLTPAMQWIFLDATWHGDSSASCKTEIVGEDGNQYLVDAPGACWTFVRVRFVQIIFGLYFAAHPEQLWRPILMFALFAALMMPLFLPQFRHKLWLGLFLIFIFPFIAFALVHGEWLGLPVADTDEWGGFMLTFILASVGIVAALPIGIVMALGRRSQMPVIHSLCVFYIELWRAAPLITILFMASNLLPLFAPEGVNFDKVVRALIAITMFYSAYVAEAIRGGLQAIPGGQSEGADALGFRYWGKTTFIILPQALKISIPGIVNTFISLFKDTTLVGIIGLHDFLGSAQVAARSSEWKGYDFEGYVFVAIIFFICCFAMSKYSQHLEAKLHTGHKQ